MNIFENNINLLKKTNPLLAEKIEKINELKSEFSFEESLSGDVNLKRNGVYLHDFTDPEQEAINLLNAIPYKGYFAINYIYGLGLGYVLKRFYKSLNGFIVVYEPDLEVLRLTFDVVDFTDELSDARVFITNDLSDLDEFYKENFFHGFRISDSCGENYKKYDYNNLKNFIERAGFIHGIYQSNYDSYWNKNHQWIEALSHNIINVSKYEQVAVLKDVFKDKPAVIISAGPSLNKNIDLIAQNQDKFVIFCVSTALKTAVNHGIKPDFVCFIESHPVTFRMLAATDNIPHNLILQPTTLDKLYDCPAKDKFIFYADNDLAACWVASVFNIDASQYINRGTVSVNALISAKIMGCNPIILTGQDLAYTNSKCYAEGSIYDNYVLNNGKIVVDNLEEIMNKTSLSSEAVQRRTEELTKKLYTVKGQNGEILSAPGDYASFIKYFSDIASDFGNDIKFYNATEGGAQIDGYENIKFSDLLDNNIINGNISKAFEYNSSLIEKKKEKIILEIKKCIKLHNKIYTKIFGMAQNVIKSINEFNVSDKNEYKKYMTQLAKLLKLYKEFKISEQSSLFSLLCARNCFFIDYYIKKFDVDEAKNLLLNYLIILFKTDYDEFIKPQVENYRKLYNNEGK